MTTIFKMAVIGILTALLGCIDFTKDPNDSRSKTIGSLNNKTTPLIDTPGSFVRNYNGQNNKLFVFVGKKIFVKPLPHERGSRDQGFTAKYLVLEKVYGEFYSDTIEFLVYDHYGTPDFSTSKNVLLFVSADSGTYYHQKYIYNHVYKTKDGRWAGPYDCSAYNHAYNKRTKIKPAQIEFAEEVSYSTKMVDNEGREFTRSFPKPYFKTVGDKAIAIYGNYVEDLFKLQRDGVLTARELFEATAEQEEDMVESMQPEPPKNPPGPDDSKFLAFWKIFIESVKEPGLKNFRNIALDTLWICDRLRSTSNFIDKCFGEVIDDEVRKRIIDRTKLEYTSDEMESTDLLTSNARKEIVRVGKEYRLRQMLVTRSSRNNNPPTIRFDFIETKKGYRLYGIDHHWFKECCK